MHESVFMIAFSTHHTGNGLQIEKVNQFNKFESIPVIRLTTYLQESIILM